MRLLDVQKLELVDVRDDSVPRYAILSHTWEDDEVTLQDMRRMQGKLPQALNKQKQQIADKKGFSKIKRAAAIAVERGFSYIWIDTCCIDKTSSSELSEAINSMYLWYKQAAECYAILSDVDSPDPADENNWLEVARQLRSSRWFTRGWTLQELIAPRNVYFYARDWRILGEKDKPPAFAQVISEITRIELEVLDARVDPMRLSVATRMRWAARRRTTRPEDTAYCLMGLFQVNMPLLYGEGDRAFTRLQEEIIQRSDDQSLFSWSSINPGDYDSSGDPDAVCGLLASCPAQFEGSGGLQPLPPLPVYASAPSTMTNLGLRVQLYLRPIHEHEGVPMEEDYHAILDCILRVGDAYMCPAIPLRRLSQDQYARLQTKPIRLLPPTQPELRLGPEGYRTIYVRQEPGYYHLPQIRVSPSHAPSDRPAGMYWVAGDLLPGFLTSRYKLMDAFPSAQWDPHTLTMGVKFSRQLQAMAVFRFQDVLSPCTNEVFDVVLGLRRLDAMQWESWCFQLSCRGHPPPLDSIFQAINTRIRVFIHSHQGPVSSAALRDSLGDDSRLVSEAAVTSVELHSRWYVSLSVSMRPEIPSGGDASAYGELRPAPNGLSPRGFLFQGLQHAVRILTRPCGKLSWTSLWAEGFSGSASPMEPQPVRSGPIKFLLPKLHLERFLSGARLAQTPAPPNPQQPIIDLAVAAFDGALSQVSSLLSAELIKSVTPDDYGLPPLFWAMAGGHERVVQYILQEGADIGYTTAQGLTALHILMLFRDGTGGGDYLPCDEILRELTTCRTTHYLETPLHMAATYRGISARSQKILRRVATHCPVAARNVLDETPIHRAAALDNAEVIQTLVPLLPQCLDFVDCFGRSPLWHAAATGSMDALDALLSLGALINLADDTGLSPLHAACREGYSEVVSGLLERGAQPFALTHEFDLSPLDLAAMFGHHYIVKMLIDGMGSHDGTQRILDRALHVAASCGELECVEELLSGRADRTVSYSYYFKLDPTQAHAEVVKQSGDSLFVAAQEGHQEVFRYLRIPLTPSSPSPERPDTLGWHATSDLYMQPMYAHQQRILQQLPPPRHTLHSSLTPHPQTSTTVQYTSTPGRGNQSTTFPARIGIYSGSSPHLSSTAAVASSSLSGQYAPRTIGSKRPYHIIRVDSG